MFCVSESKYEEFYQNIIARLDRASIRGDKTRLKEHLGIMTVFNKYMEIVKKYNPYRLSSSFELKDGNIVVSIEMYKFFECCKGSRVQVLICPPSMPYILQVD